MSPVPLHPGAAGEVAGGLRAAPRTGPWREGVAPASGALWGVRRTNATSLDVEWARTRTGKIRTFSRRATAYAHAEALNEREFRRAGEDRAALGIPTPPNERTDHDDR